MIPEAHPPEPVLCNKSSCCSEKPTLQHRGAPTCHNQRKPEHSHRDPLQPKHKYINKNHFKKYYKRRRKEMGMEMGQE